MKSKQSYPLSPRLLLAAMYLGTLTFSIAPHAQADGANPDSQESMPVLPLEQSASRGITTRDPSSIVKYKDEYWVFYTGRGVPSYHSKDLEKWERGPAVFKTAPEWIAQVVPEKVIGWFHFGNMPHESARRSMQLMASEVISARAAFDERGRPI